MTILTVNVASGNDDGEERSSGTMSLTGTTLTVNEAGEMIGMRFLNVTVPKNSTINSAVLTFNIGSASYDDPDVNWKAEDADNAAAFAATSNNFTPRTLTTAVVTQTATGIGTGNKTITLTSLVQEVVERGGWVSGNALNIFAVGRSTSEFRPRSYEAGYPASLEINYTIPPTPGNPALLFMMMGG